MELGQFSVSLAVKNITESKVFYEKLGFKCHPECGSIEDKWLIMQKDAVVIGLFEGMFEHNILTFNPSDARAIEKSLIAQDLVIQSPTTEGSGPTHFMLKDPDGNAIMFDQF